MSFNSRMDASLSSACADALMRTSIRSEFRSWAKTAETNYSYLATRRAHFGVVSVEWLPEKQVDGEGNAIHSALVTGRQNGSYNLGMMRWTQTEKREVEEESKEMEWAWGVQLPGDVNRARHMPQLSSILAVHSSDSVSIHTLRSPSPQPSLSLLGQQSQGFGLDWNTHLAGMLLSAAYDRNINLWDVQLATALNRTVVPVRTWTLATEPEDVAWSPHSATVFLSVDRSGVMSQYDSRRRGRTGEMKAHAGIAFSVDVNKMEESLVVTAGQDKTVAVWDLRLPGVKLSVFHGHTDFVISARWAPFSRTLFCSASHDRKVHIWSADQTDRPKPVFTHSGHTTPLTDVCWNATERLLLASGAEDSVHMWAMKDELSQSPTV